MAEEQAAHHLLNVLEERGLDVDLDKILLAFEDEEKKVAVATWVEEYLHDDTLLTKEEHELYSTLKRKGLLHQYESENEPIRPFLDHEMSSAIESLKSSTAAIEEQCKVLEAQKVALMRLKGLDQPNMDVEHARNERRRKEAQEKARLDIAVDDVSLSLTEQLDELHRDIDTDISTLQGYLSERLASDDQILSRLPGIVSQIIAEPELSEDEKSIEQWCKAIIAFRCSDINARVDSIYLTNLKVEDAESEASEQDLKERKAALQAEMEELHAEIASVAEMVVEHEIRKPLNEMRVRKERESKQTRSAWQRYVLSTLDYMGKRLDMITPSTNDVDELQETLAHIQGAASSRLAEAQDIARSPTRRRTSTGPSSAFAPALKLRPSKTLEIPTVLQDALRQAGVSFHHDSIESLQDSLIHTQQERDKKLHDHYETTAVSIHDKLAERSSKLDADMQIITDGLYKYSQFHQISLSNPRLQEGLERLERELEQKEQDLIEAEGSEVRLDDPKVRAFITKYGR